MRNILCFILFLSFSFIKSQETLDPFYIYGPREDQIFIDLNKALKQSNTASKLKLINVNLSSDAKKLDNFDSLAVLVLENNQLSNFPIKFYSNSNLQYLSSVGNPLGNFSSEVFGLRSLIILKLYHTKIDSFPPSFKYLVSLKEFEFQLNSDTCSVGTALSGLRSVKKILINKVPLRECPKDLNKSINLKELYLANCNLSKLDSNLFLSPNLETLILDGNPLNEIPREIINLKTLKILSLRNTQLKNYPEFLGKLKNLEELDIRDNTINQLDLNILQILLPKCRIITN